MKSHIVWPIHSTEFQFKHLGVSKLPSGTRMIFFRWFCGFLRPQRRKLHLALLITAAVCATPLHRRKAVYVVFFLGWVKGKVNSVHLWQLLALLSSSPCGCVVFPFTVTSVLVPPTTTHLPQHPTQTSQREACFFSSPFFFLYLINHSKMT